MPDPVSSVTTTILALALDAAALRQQAIASNIANAGIPGQGGLAVNFEEQLGEARRTLQAGRPLDGSELAGVQPTLRPLNGAVHLDDEATRIARNSVHFQALLKGLNHHYRLLSAAVSDGRK